MERYCCSGTACRCPDGVGFLVVWQDLVCYPKALGCSRMKTAPARQALLGLWGEYQEVASISETVYAGMDSRCM